MISLMIGYGLFIPVGLVYTLLLVIIQLIKESK